MLKRRIPLKKPDEIEHMRHAGQLVAQALVLAQKKAAPGVTTLELDQLVDEFFQQHQAESLFKGYPGRVPFPAVCCISVNEEVVHGIPKNRELIEGDMVTIDTGCRVHGWCGDSAITFGVGKLADDRQQLLDVSKQALQIALDEIKPGVKWSSIAQKMQGHVESFGYVMVEDFVGHGIGKEMHEKPEVPAYDGPSCRKNDFRLQPGMTIAIEPMVNMGKKKVKILKDHWTVVTTDGKPSVHVEHTVAVTDDGADILTDRSAFE